MKRFFTIFIMIILFEEYIFAVDIEFKAGLTQQQLSGSISNINSDTAFENELAYDTTYSSLFSLEFRDMNYIPNIKLSYMNTQESSSAVLDKTIVIANSRFDQNSSVFSEIDYKQFNALIYKDFFLQGTYLFDGMFYSGDIEMDLGINVQYTQWNFDIKNISNPTQAVSYIYVNSFIASPSLAVKYYLYHVSMEIFADALAYQDEKVLHYGANISYNFDTGVVVSLAYNYNKFELTEKEDKVDFSTAGVTFMFGYHF